MNGSAALMIAARWEEREFSIGKGVIAEEIKNVSGGRSSYGASSAQLSSSYGHTGNRLMLCSFQHEKNTVGQMTARPRNPTKRTKKLSAPAHEGEVQDFYEACAWVKLVPATTLRELAAAFVQHVDERGHIVTPLRFADAPKKG